MIWVRGAIVADDELTISVLDSTFEHGLGLFETFRTWSGHATLLPRHLDRMTHAAAALGLPLDPAELPDAAAVAALLRADGRAGDAVLRITMSGGTPEGGRSVVWMRSAPLPTPVEGGYRLGRPWGAEYGDEMAAYKSLNYWRRRRAYEQARAEGFDEILVLTDDLQVREGSRTNVFVVKDGVVLTPVQSRGLVDHHHSEAIGRQSIERPIVPGIMRGLILERARCLGIEVREVNLSETALRRADEVFLTNSVRGIIPVRSWLERQYPAPGPLTRRLWDDARAWLESGGAIP